MCTLEKRGPVYLLTLTGPGEHRLNPTLLTSLRSALAELRSVSTPSALVTAADGKFFSNGFDLALAAATSPSELNLMSSLLQRTIADLLSLPMPTIAAVTGHAAAGGLVLALSHDYVIMRSDRGFLYMSEVDIGMVIPEYFERVVRAKVGGWRGVREMVMRAEKVRAAEGVAMGVVDAAAEGVEGTVAAAVRLGEELVARGWDGKVYAANRMAVLGDVFKAVTEEEEVKVKSKLWKWGD